MYVCMYTSLYMYIQIHINSLIHTYIHTYIYIHRHTHIHIHVKFMGLVQQGCYIVTVACMHVATVAVLEHFGLLIGDS